VMSDEDGLQPVMLHDMMRQIFAYGWTRGIALQGDDVWEWDILAQTWLLNGTAMDMAIITPRGDVLLDRPISPPTVSHKQSQEVQRCVDGHWNSCKASTCRHCNTSLLL
jgi:hypothetical protein